MENNLMVSSTPHIRSKETISTVMLDVVIALIPAAVMGVVYFGMRALALMVISVVSAVVFEALYQKLTGKKVTVTDFSAVITGLLLAMNLPSTAPFWVPVVGAFFAIIIVKQLFGGLGQNFMNPALGARAFLVASYPTYMTGAAFVPTSSGVIGALDATTTATPLSQLSEGTIRTLTQQDYINALIGNVGGVIGETCAIALVIGGLYLIIRKVISWRIPVTYILTVFLLTWLFKLAGIAPNREPLYELLTGGLMLGAFFMATDYASSPMTPVGQLIMGVGCGVFTTLIRIFGGYPEGVSYSILLMNLCVPLIDRYTAPKIFGEVKKK